MEYLLGEVKEKFLAKMMSSKSLFHTSRKHIHLVNQLTQLCAQQLFTQN